MKSGKGMFWTAALAGGIGAGFGSVSGSNSIVVVISVGVVISLLVVWGVSGMLK